MSFDTYIGGLLFLYIPVFIVVALVRGVPTSSGRFIALRQSPGAFWLILWVWLVFLIVAASLMWAGDPRSRHVFAFAFGLMLLGRAATGLSQGWRTGRFSATERVSQPSAYWSAAFGLILLAVVAVGLIIMAAAV